MIVDKIDVSGDPRVEQRTADINGKQYGMQYSCEEIEWHDILPCEAGHFEDSC